MRVRMELLTDTIFGNGNSVPGAEDISVLCDEQGFPYFKGGTFKGVFREELERYLMLTDEYSEEKVMQLLGASGDHDDSGKIVFSDFVIAEQTKKAILEEVSAPHIITDITTHLRSFTAINDAGMAKKGSLRVARCVDKGICFYSSISCRKEDEELVKDVLGLIKWIGTMRNRGFGKISLSVVE